MLFEEPDIYLVRMLDFCFVSLEIMFPSSKQHINCLKTFKSVSFFMIPDFGTALNVLRKSEKIKANNKINLIKFFFVIDSKPKSIILVMPFAPTL